MLQLGRAHLSRSHGGPAIAAGFEQWRRNVAIALGNAETSDAISAAYKRRWRTLEGANMLRGRSRNINDSSKTAVAHQKRQWLIKKVPRPTDQGTTGKVPLSIAYSAPLSMALRFPMAFRFLSCSALASALLFIMLWFLQRSTLCDNCVPQRCFLSLLFRGIRRAENVCGSGATPQSTLGCLQALGERPA